VGFFNVSLDNKEEEDTDGDHNVELFDDGGTTTPPVGVNPEVQPTDLAEEEALKLAIA
jgi:hypothetical protein